MLCLCILSYPLYHTCHPPPVLFFSDSTRVKVCTEKTDRVTRGFYYIITVGTLYSIIIQYLVSCNTRVTKKVRMDLVFTIHKKRSSISSVCSYGTLPVVLLKPLGNNSLECGSQIGPVPTLFFLLYNSAGKPSFPLSALTSKVA